ncbi:class A beta-lactamase [Mycetocola sp. JXN-3]|uniref:class A beta-lactamase n=1 Tax=Mycetocola sp. JXN-3 TaxID=2116510 RepID=UPI00165D1638|nr:class A beta-lactamase [Mycetocola sp. JXN-3]
MTHLNRRNFLGLATIGAAGLLAACTAKPAHSTPPTMPSDTPQASPTAPRSDTAFAALEAEYGARLGLFLIDTGSQRTVEYRADERFAFASTIKAHQAAAILQTREIAALQEHVTFTAEQIVSYSPITEQHIEDGMLLHEVVTAALQYSDNTAANLMFDRLGGPSGLQQLLRESGDHTINMDRIEPDLNEATPGDPRDTTTPRAHAHTLARFGVSDHLPAEKRELLTGWMKANTTGGELIRAGVPADWVVADKTGGGYYGTRNDIAILWPPTGAPLVLAVMSSKEAQDAEYSNALIARATTQALATLTAGH